MKTLRHLALLAALLCFTQPARPDGGTTGLTFLTLGVGARSLGMGEAYSTATDDPAGLHYNPATIGSVGTTTISFMHRAWIQGTNAEYLTAAFPLGAVSLAASVYSVGVDDIEVRDTPGEATSTFTARNASLGLTLGYTFSPELSVGVTAKYVYEKILVDDAGGMAFDLGAVYATSFGARIGAAVSNLGSMTELGNQASTLPELFRGGASYSTELAGPDATITGAADVVVPFGDGSTHVHLGAESLLYGTVSLRLGYQTGYDARSFTAGAGFRKGIVGIDYAFMPTRYDLGATHAISLAVQLR
jgi:hypothetical protein